MVNVNGVSGHNVDAKSIASSESGESSEEDFYDTIKHGSRKKVRKIFKHNNDQL